MSEKELIFKATLWSEDGGKTWGVQEVFYLKEGDPHMEKRVHRPQTRRTLDVRQS